MTGEDRGKLRGIIRIEKYKSKKDTVPYEVIESENCFLTTGCTEIWALVKGGADHFDNTNSRIGIGTDKTTAPAPSQTDLQSPHTYKGMDSGYPDTPASGGMKFKATFGGSDANCEWGELAIKNNASGICLNRSTNGGAGWGPKDLGEIWIFTYRLSLS